MSKTILFFGNERLATGTVTELPVIKALLSNGYGVPAIVLSRRAQGKSRSSRALEMAEFANQNNIPIIEAHDQLGSKIRQLGVSAGVLVAYGQIVPKELIDMVPGGIINLHPSLLPHYRGSTPIESAILDGVDETGVSLMRLTPELDEGPIYDQAKVSLNKTESKPGLTHRLDELGAELLIKNLPAILDGSLAPVAQAEADASYTKRIEKNSGELDYNKSAEELEREIRAYSGWPRSTTYISSDRVVITKASITTGQGSPGQFFENAGKLNVYTSKGVLVIEGLIPAGRKEMSGQAFLAGHKLT